MKVKITQEIIDRSRELLSHLGNWRCESCPVALALGPGGWTTGETYRNNDNPTRRPLSDEAKVFIDQFDNGVDVQPCEIELDVPEGETV